MGDVRTRIGREIVEHNRDAWDHQVHSGCRWTLPVSAEAIASARAGRLELLLTPRRVVPSSWFPPLRDCRVLGLAAGGGQQGPLLAAAGAKVTVFDNAPAQLEQDRLVAQREGLSLRLVQGDMADLGQFEDGSFDLVFHPVSNCFVPDVLPVWREAFRVLRSGGRLLAGTSNPLLYLFDDTDARDPNALLVRHRIPHSDAVAKSSQERLAAREAGDPLEFGHSLEDQLGGQLAAGFVLTAMFEDIHHWDEHPLNPYIKTFIATCAVKP